MTQNDRCKKLRCIFQNTANAINSLHIDPVSLSKVVDEFHACKGKIVTTGLGKNGIAMRKFAATLCSLGIPSCYLHPGEASHGDLGILSKNDLLFVSSTSGKTREIMEVIDLSRGMNIKKIIGITSHPDSPIRDKLDIVLDMGIVEEEGHLKLAPTTSIIVILVITDAIALIVSEENGFTAKDYLLRHHSGYLASVAKGIAENN